MDPFCNEDVTLLVEAGIVRVNELAGLPTIFVAANREILVVLDSLDVLAQLRNDLVVLIQERDTGNQLGNQQQVLI